MERAAEKVSLKTPEEHGAWAILLVPFLCAAALASSWDAPSALHLAQDNLPLLLCAFCVLALFLLRASLVERTPWLRESNEQKAARHRLAASVQAGRRLLAPLPLLLTLFGAGTGGLLVFQYERYQLLWVALAAAALYFVQHQLSRAHRAQKKEKRSLPAELAGVVILTLTAPAAWISARGSLLAAKPGVSWGEMPGVKVWLLNLLFFLGGILYVKYRVRGLSAHRSFGSLKERLAFAWPVFLYHFLLVTFLVGWWVEQWVSAPQEASAVHSAVLVLAFAPGIFRAYRLLFSLGRRFPIRQVGWSEILHAAVFATLLVTAFRMAA